MKKQILVLSLLLTSSIVFLPIQGSAATGADPSVVTKASPQIRVQIGRNRGRHRGWYRGHRMGRYYGNDDYYNRRSARFYRNRNNRTMVRQTYYVNGRRYTRLVRSY